MRCPRVYNGKECGQVCRKDADEFWCLAHGMISTPYRAGDPLVSNYPWRNRRKFDSDEDTEILLRAPDWIALRDTLHRPVHVIRERWEQIRALEAAE